MRDNILEDIYTLLERLGKQIQMLGGAIPELKEPC